MMASSEDLHARMVDGLVAEGRISTPQLEAAFRSVPRHPFLPDVAIEKVYGGEAIPIRFGPDGIPTSSSSEPGIMATMLDQLRVDSGATILEIGTGGGYNAALLATLVGPMGDVTTIDIDRDVVEQAREGLQATGFPGVTTVVADGWLGAPEGAPYDRIEVTVGAWDVSPRWVEQLAEGGLLLVPLWLRAGVQASVVFRRMDGQLWSTSIEPCGFMRLRGPHAGPESYVNVNGWAACLDDADEHDLFVLQDLLSGTSRTGRIAAPPSGWFERFALKEPSAVQLWTLEPPFRARQGLFDALTHSLALIEGDEVMSFGSDVALQRLKHELSQLAPFDLRGLRVVAVQAPSSVEANWVLTRPNFVFGLSEGRSQR